MKKTEYLYKNNISMVHPINQEEINALIAQELREKGLNDVLNLNAIKEKVSKKIQEFQGGEQINELENPGTSVSPNEFPQEEEEKNAPIKTQEPEKANSTQNVQPQAPMSMEAGTQPLGDAMTPKVALSDVPDFLKNIDPGKVFIFDYNELSESGENLSHKPFKTMENPEFSKSLNQMWSEEGKTRAEVHQAKFEKIGDLEYDYRNGTTKFVANNEQPLADENGVYKENPYKVESNPVIEKDIENYITNNVDMDAKINDVISNIVKSYFMTNSERAIETSVEAPIPTEQPYLQNMAENKELKLKDLVEVGSKFTKIDTPKEVENAFRGEASSALIIKENLEVKQIKFNNKDYFIPKNPISIKKCYIKTI